MGKEREKMGISIPIFDGKGKRMGKGKDGNRIGPELNYSSSYCSLLFYSHPTFASLFFLHPVSFQNKEKSVLEKEKEITGK